MTVSVFSMSDIVSVGVVIFSRGVIFGDLISSICLLPDTTILFVIGSYSLKEALLFTVFKGVNINDSLISSIFSGEANCFC